MATLCDLGWSLATFSLFVEDILANFHPQLALQIPIKSMPSSANYQTYLDDVDGVDERDGDDGGSSGHADLLEESRAAAALVAIGRVLLVEKAGLVRLILMYVVGLVFERRKEERTVAVPHEA